MAEQPLILVTNDDGVFAPGLKALAAEMALVGRVVVIAPTGTIAPPAIP